MSKNSLETCILAWRQGRPLSSTDETLEASADRHFSLGEFDTAERIYSGCPNPTDDTLAKRGWCLAVLDKFDAAEDLLTPERCGSNSAELAVLALVIAGGWNASKLSKGFGVQRDDIKARDDHVLDLITRALKNDIPDPLAFFVYKALIPWYLDREAALIIAERAIDLFSHPALIEWHVMLLRTLGRPSETALDAMLNKMPDKPWDSYVGEIFETAIELSRHEDAKMALDIFGSKLVRKDMPTFDLELILLRAYVDLRSFSPTDTDHLDDLRNALGSTRKVLEELHALPKIDYAIDEHIRFAAKLHLALAVTLEDANAIRESTKVLVNAFWSEESTSEYTPACEMLWLGQFAYHAQFGVNYISPIVENSLSPEDRVQWQLFKALHSVLYSGEIDSEAKEIVSTYGPALAPAWAAAAVAETLLDSNSPPLYGVGRAIAEHCLYVERTSENFAELTEFNFDSINVNQLGDLVEGVDAVIAGLPKEDTASGRLLISALGPTLYSKKRFEDLKNLADLIAARTDDHRTLFYGALARQELSQNSEARAMYESLIARDPDHSTAYWNLALIYDITIDPEALEEMMPLLDGKAHVDESWIKTRDHVRAALYRARQRQAEADMRAFVHRELSHYPPLQEAPIEPESLSLLEAASLLALVRAGDLDHSNWTISPFDKSSIPFEPTNRFRPALLDLARKGIIQVADSTPLNAFVAVEGTLRFRLGQVEWRISPNTLALERAIKDIARSDWPRHWIAHAEALSRDLATEECVAYMEYLAEERGLDAPDPTDSRALFRELLEHCSAGKCWYYIYSGVQSANDYRTKYRVSKEKVTAMMLKRTRERGEIAIAKGWDTQYNRIRALPRSHLSAGLHDVLTGWGERAFEEPIRLLSKPDPQPSKPPYS